MRPVAVACVIVAGTAVRLLFDKLNSRDQDQDQQHQQHTQQSDDLHSQTSQNNPSSTIQSNTSTTQQLPPPTNNRQQQRRHHRHHHSPTTKLYRHPQVVALLNSTCPRVSAQAFIKSFGTEHDCTFCLDTINLNSTPIRVTPCRHAFHATCLEQWVDYTAFGALDWRNYLVSDDGVVDFTAPLPSCPNCTTKLRVLPCSLVHTVLLTAIARSYNLPDLSIALQLLRAGVVLLPQDHWLDAQPHGDNILGDYGAFTLQNLDAYNFVQARLQAQAQTHHQNRAQIQARLEAQVQAIARNDAEAFARAQGVSTNSNHHHLHRGGGGGGNTSRIQSSSSSGFYMFNSVSAPRSPPRSMSIIERTQMTDAGTAGTGQPSMAGSSSSLAHVRPPSMRTTERTLWRNSSEQGSPSSQSPSVVVDT